MVTSSFVRTIAVLLALFSLASCIAAPRTEFMGPNGKMVYAISCQTIDDCATEAREIMSKWTRNCSRCIWSK